MEDLNLDIINKKIINIHNYSEKDKYINLYIKDFLSKLNKSFKYDNRICTNKKKIKIQIKQIGLDNLSCSN